MDSLFGIPLTNILIGLLVVSVAIGGLLGFIAWRNPLLVRMGLRNLTRRKSQTVLIVIGLMLSTLIISAAFATGDTVGYSVTNAAYNDYGEADVIVAFDRDTDAADDRDGLLQEDVEALRAAIAADPEAATDLDGLTGIIRTPAPALNPDARLSEPVASFVGIDPATTDDFHQLVNPQGDLLLAGDLAAGEVFVSEKLAEDIRLGVGDTVRVFYDNQPYDFTVRDIVRDNALTAATALTSAQAAGGVVAPIERVREITNEPGRIDLIVVSASGGIRDSLEATERLRERIDSLIETQGLPMQVISDKAEVVAFAELIGSFFVTFFLGFGLFSIAAGIMLIFLTFVMLAAERRSEMGMARAVGMKRLHLTESFIAEGMAYNLGSALIGAFLGLAVAYALITVLGSVFGDFGLSITFNFNPVGFVIAYLLGVVITFVTVAFSSWRSANLNIVRAIRDIPEPELTKGRDTSAAGLAKSTVGAAWYVLWVLIVAIASVLVFYAFIASLAFYGLPLIAVAGLIAGFIWGLRRFGRPRGRRALAGLVAWWIAFNVVGLLSFFLLRTKGWADRHRTSGGWAVLMIVVGVLGTWWGGWVAQQAFAYTAGTTLLLFASAMLATYFGAPAKPTFASISALTVWYWLLPLPFSLFFEAGKGWTDPLDGLFGLVGLGHPPIVGNIEMFFVSGVSITAASTLFVIFNADRLLGAVGALQGVFGGITPAIRTAISYPLASKFRTGMTLAMFTLVMFSLVVMATLNYNFTQLFLGEEAKGGFDVQVQANPNNPIEDLRAALVEGGYDVEGNVDGVGTMTSIFAEVKAASDDDDALAYYRFAGLDDEFIDLANFPTTTTAIGYADAAAVMEALRTDPTAVLANESILSFTQSQNFGAGGEDQFTVEGSITDLQDTPWEPIPLTVIHPDTGEAISMRIIGFVDSPIISGVVPSWFALFVGEAAVTGIADPLQDFFVTTVDDGDQVALDVAAGIESTLLERGVQADSLTQRVADSAAQSNAFSTLFQAFMSLGLIVGIAALGVIAFRTVAERRQQIGMLRAIGYSRRLVAISFFLESSFIAVAGIGMGLVLGAALAYNLMTSPEFTNGAEVDFGIPWARLLLIVAVAYVASAVMTLIPARSASRVAVAEALRYSA